MRYPDNLRQEPEGTLDSSIIKSLMVNQISAEVLVALSEVEKNRLIELHILIVNKGNEQSLEVFFRRLRNYCNDVESSVHDTGSHHAMAHGCI